MLITVRCWAHVPRYRSCSCLAIRSVSSTTHCVVLANEVFPWLTLSIEDRPFRSPKDAFIHAEMVFRFSSTEEKTNNCREKPRKNHTRKKKCIPCTLIARVSLKWFQWNSMISLIAYQSIFQRLKPVAKSQCATAKYDFFYANTH